MFGDLPKLFDRNFAIGFLLPAGFFTAINVWLLYVFGLLPPRLMVEATHLLTEPEQSKTLIGLYGVAAFIIGLLLLATSHQVTQLLEGYGDWNPFRLIAGLERGRFRHLAARKESLLAERDAQPPGSEEYDRLHDRAAAIMQTMVPRFPDELEAVLPTAFGNTMRAFESHPLVMYGLDAIPAWARLLAVVPKDYREVMDGARAQLDFWMNSWFFTAIFSIEFAVAACLHPTVKTSQLALWVALAAAFLIYLFSEMAKQATVAWGEYVKAAFDMFLPDMVKKLGLKPPANREEEEAMWSGLSAALVFGVKDLMPARDYTAKLPPADPPADR